MQPQQVRFLTVTLDEDGQRLDNYLMSRLKGVPKSAIYRVIRKGEVRVNKGRVKPLRRLLEGDVVRIPPMLLAEQSRAPEPSAALSSVLEASVLYDRDGLMIVNKPSGLAVHGGSGINLGMIEALRKLPGNEGFLELVHRLDRDTSGCVMIARKRSVLKKLQEALRERQGIQKKYVALVYGAWPKNHSFVDVPLKRFLINGDERVVRVHDEGKPSQTKFSILQRYSDATLIEASPITGRTHQIRVHAQHVGCPLVGDEKYGDGAEMVVFKRRGCKRLFLHAASLTIQLPESTPIFVEAPLPAELSEFLEVLNRV